VCAGICHYVGIGKGAYACAYPVAYSVWVSVRALAKKGHVSCVASNY
jgi:hypothetical protein